jgi:cobalt/nickel transport system permease protein
MHIAEAILAGTAHGREILAAGAVVAAAGTAVGLRKLDYERVPQVAVLCAAFFVISLIHVPLGPVPAHLVLCGLMGLVLGWAAFPAVLVALALQSVFLSYGGLTALGLNTLVMAVPAVVCWYLFRRAVRSRFEPLVFVTGFLAGAVGMLLGATLAAAALFAAGKSFAPFAQVVLAAHLPMAVVEGLVTGSVVVLLRKVRPELLDAPMLAAVPQEGVHVQS